MMHPRRGLRAFALLLSAALLSPACATPDRPAAVDDPAAEDWIDLLADGGLDRWTPKIRRHEVGDDSARTFRVEDGVLKVRYDGYDEFGDQFGHLYFDQPYSHYRLSLEYRFVGDPMPDAPDWARLNSGVMFHSQDPRTMPIDQDWPIAVEFQLLAGEEGETRSTGNVCTPGTTIVLDGELEDERHCIESSAATYPRDRWVHAELLVLGDSLVRHIIEGEPVLEYTRPAIGGGTVSGFDPAVKRDGRALTGGFIALQSEGHEVDFRNVRLLDLEGCTDPDALNFRGYFEASDPSKCRYADGAVADRTEPYFVYVGTTTGDPTDGVHVLRFDPSDGALEAAEAPVAAVMNPSVLALGPDGGTLYAVSETEPGRIVAFRRDRGTGALTEIGRRSSGGAGPAYVSIDDAGRWVAAANYGAGSVALLPVGGDGGLGDPVAVVQHEGSGPDPERQEAPHAHFAKPSPDGRWLYVVDLGIDQVIAYPLVGGDEGLDAEGAAVTPAAPGAGPRHLDFHPTRPFVYVMNELAGTVTVYRYDAESGGLAEIETIPSVPVDFDGENKSADIHVHPSGRWLYASNRGEFDSIALFEIDPATGRLTPRGYTREGIVWPRNFTLDPTGRWMLVANQTADEVRVYAVDPGTGELRPTPHRVEVPGPTNITLAPAG